MPVLKNARHERFAQELAKGASQTDAYLAAGYQSSAEAARRSASDLMTKPDVSARVSEIKQAGANRAEVSVARFTTDLIRIATKAEALDGAPGLAVAKGAIMDAAKLNGLAPDRIEHTGADGGPIETKDVSAREIVERRIAGLSARGGESEHTGKPH